MSYLVFLTNLFLSQQTNLPKLFGQYVQFDASTLQGGKGSGLGLWLSKAIVGEYWALLFVGGLIKTLRDVYCIELLQNNHNTVLTQ